MKNLRESLFDSETQMTESLFDSNLVSKEADYEYLYGLIKRTIIINDFAIDYLDERKIKRDFNTIIKKFPPKQWSKNVIDRMDKYQPNETAELMRELIYIIAGNIKISDILTNDGDINYQKMVFILKNIINNYVKDDFEKYVFVDDISNQNFRFPGLMSIQIKFFLGRQLGRYSKYVQACKIFIAFDPSLL